MKDWSTTDAIIKGVEAILGAMVLFLSFVGKSMYNKFTTMEDKIEKLERSQEKDSYLIDQVKKDADNEIKRIENEFINKVSRLEEITEMRLDAIDRNTEKLTNLVESLHTTVSIIERKTL